MKRFFFTALVCVWSACLSDRAAASITITSNLFQAEAIDTSASPPFDYDMQSFTGISITTPVTVRALTETSTSTNFINWTTAGGETVLAFDIFHFRDGEPSSGASSVERLRFTANASAAFELSGYYDVSDGGLQSGSVFLSASLADITAGGFLFTNQQFSADTHNEQFTLGEMAGDTTNNLQGSLAGMFTLGHSYELRFHTSVTADPDEDLGAAAIGNITLTIGERATAATPEPVSMLVWGGLIAAAGLVTQRRGSRLSCA
jgi:hypothetical protein